MDWITPEIAIGNAEDALALNESSDHIDSVLCLSGFPTLSYLKQVRWHGIPLIDGAGNAIHHISGALNTIHSEVAEGRKILVHCREGKSRSVLMVALYLAATERKHLDHAIHFVKTRRTIADIDRHLIASLPEHWRGHPEAETNGAPGGVPSLPHHLPPTS